jgi:bifunctional N-acetylglucosamine-1-phosphate-uridyltransferase/glucosamine-1-phosphate-acetyltransferase GlmU-like protein
MEIKNSMIGEGTHFHSGYMGDSVTGQNCRFGAGFITANKRIDRGNIKSVVKGGKVDTGLVSFGCAVGDNSKFGIHAGTMPGVLIGSDCLIGPGTLVFENLKDNTTFYSEFKNHKEERE